MIFDRIRNSSKGWRARTTAVAAFTAMTLFSTQPSTACQPKGTWLSGDFHQHTYYTDGSTSFDFVMGQNNEFGLDWWANSEHGGSRNRN